MKKLEVKDLKENFFEAIGKEWMLVTAGTKEKFNTMTASWGGIGWLWNKPVAFISLITERYTYEFVDDRISGIIPCAVCNNTRVTRIIFFNTKLNFH